MALPGYHRLHARVKTRRGRPKACEHCGTTDPRKAYDWANMTGRYDDPSDYKRLCRACHMRLDRAKPARKDAPHSQSTYVKKSERGVGLGPERPCECGCGTLLTQFDEQGRERRYVAGHFLKHAIKTGIQFMEMVGTRDPAEINDEELLTFTRRVLSL